MQRQRHGLVGKGEDVPGEARGEPLGGYGLAALGPGGVGGDGGAVHRHPVEREGAAQFGRVGAGLGIGEALAALGCGVQRVAEEQGLFGFEEEGAVVVGGAGASLGEEEGHVPYGVGDPADEFGAVAVRGLRHFAVRVRPFTAVRHTVLAAVRGPPVAAVRGLPAQQRGEGDGVQWGGGRGALEGGRAQAVPAGG